MKKAVVLFSGGLDSTTSLAIARSSGYQCYCLSFYYGQKHKIEIEAAKKIISYFGDIKEHKIITIDLSSITFSALTSDIDVPKHNDLEHLQDNNIPLTYVPARNTIFLAYALAYAEVIGSVDIFIGANAIDYSNYPDCRPEYIDAFEKMANLGTVIGIKNGKIKIRAPLLYLSKSEIISEGIKLGIDYSLTMSCYDPGEQSSACGMCDSCLLRKQAFKKLGMNDPVQYQVI